MKKTSEYLGQIIVALVSVCLLITSVALFKAPIGDFFGNIIDAEKGTVDKFEDKFEQTIPPPITSGYDFHWQQATLSSEGTLQYSMREGISHLNNYITPILYFKNIELNLSDNLLVCISYYDKQGNFLSKGSWQSKEATTWSEGGTEQIIIENSYVRIAIADTSMNSTGSYTLTSQELASRLTYTIIGTSHIGKYCAEAVQCLPNIELGTDGCGFTCTGLTYDVTEDCFYVGNYNSTKHTIVRLSKDGKTNKGEIKLYETFPDLGDVQGVTIDRSDNSIWFASYVSNKIYHISKDGTSLGSFAFAGANGIAYDSRTDTLWVLTYGSGGDYIKNINKIGEVIKSIPITGISDLDQVYLDEENNIIYFTAGANYSGVNYVYTLNLSTTQIKQKYALLDSFAIEGICIMGDYMYIMNDGYFHEATIYSNVMNIYNLSQFK